MPRNGRFHPLTGWRLLLLMGLWGLCATAARADLWVDPHDDPATTWEVDTSSGAQVQARERVRLPDKLRGGETGAERIAYAAPPGMPAWAWRDVPQAAVIEELKIEVDLQTTLPSALIAAEVVLPHTTNEKGEMLTLRLRSAPSPGAAGVTTLKLEGLPTQLQREARVWRVTNPDKSIDTRGAYLRRVGVGLPGSGRSAQAWINELRIASIVAPPRFGNVGDIGVAEAGPTTLAPPPGGVIRRTQVTLQSDGFRIDGELFFPRLWQSRGETLATLASRGVNTVWLDHPPTPQEMADASHYRLRIVCPAPTADEAAGVESWDRVLAWVLPGELGARDLDTGVVKADDARALPPDALRPVLAQVTEATDSWSRVADGLLVPAGLTVPAGTPKIEAVRLDIGPKLTAQLDAILGDGLAIIWLPPADIASAVDRAIVGGAIGVSFTADQRLDEPDDATIAAAGWLEAVNRRLRLIEPWLTGPRSTHPVTGNQASVLLNRGGIRLATAPSLAPAPAERAEKLLLPGVDETARVYRLSAAGVAPWPLERIAGGIGVRPTGGDSPGDLLVCNDARVVKSLQTYTAQSAPRAAANLLEVAETRVRETEALAPADRQVALRRLNDARLAMSRRDYASAYDASHAALALASTAEVTRRDIASRQSGWLTSSPLAVLPSTLTDAYRMNQLLASSPRGENLLHGGSFEDIDELRRFGWRHPSTKQGSQVEVELIAETKVHGQRALRLRGSDLRAASHIDSPEIELHAGDTIEITGWARVAAPDSRGRLAISETLGGEELALTSGDTAGEWKPFHLLRATSVATTTRVTFAIEGAVTADIDGVMVRTIEPLGVANRSNGGRGIR
jgi:hypothetical protein